MNKVGITTLLSAAAIIGAIATINAFADQVQGYILKPAYLMMGQINAYDKMTDSMTDDVKELETQIREVERDLELIPDNQESSRKPLERQLEWLRKTWKTKDGKLDQAKEDEQRTLSLINQLAS